MIKKLSGDPTRPRDCTNVTSDQIASALLLNGKAKAYHRFFNRYIHRDIVTECNECTKLFSSSDLDKSIMELKNGKAPSVDALAVD